MPAPADVVEDNYTQDYKFSDPITVDSQANDNVSAAPSEIPDDWFLPKVFKGSKKTNN